MSQTSTLTPTSTICLRYLNIPVSSNQTQVLHRYSPKCCPALSCLPLSSHQLSPLCHTLLRQQLSPGLILRLVQILSSFPAKPGTSQARFAIALRTILAVITTLISPSVAISNTVPSSATLAPTPLQKAGPTCRATITRTLPSPGATLPSLVRLLLSSL